MQAEFTVKALEKRAGELPPLKLDHLGHLTDQTGILQHAMFTIPNYREGYTTDDNARALMASVLLEDKDTHIDLPNVRALSTSHS